MKINEAGINLIKSFEGCVLKAYKCPAGVWTIGYGHTKDVVEGMTITSENATRLLKSDLEKFEKIVSKYDSVYHFNENQFSALVSFAYNIGNIDGLTAKGTRSIGEISEKILLYNKAAGKVLAGLTRRRKAEQELFNKPVSTSGSGSAGKKYKVTASALNVRKGAGIGCTKCGILYKGNVVEVTQEKSGWGYIGTGWICLKYVTPV